MSQRRGGQQPRASAAEQIANMRDTKERVTSMVNNSIELVTRVEELEAQAVTANGEIRTLKATLRTANRKIRTLEGNIRTSNIRYNTLNNQLNNMADRMALLEAQQRVPVLTATRDFLNDLHEKVITNGRAQVYLDRTEIDGNKK